MLSWPSFNDGYFLIVQIYHLVGVFYDRSSIRRQEELVFTDTHQPTGRLCGRLPAGSIFQRHDNNGISADYLGKSEAHRFVQRATFFSFDVFNEVNEHFGVSIAEELMTFIDELLFQRAVVLDDNAVNNSQLSGSRVVRV